MTISYFSNYWLILWYTRIQYIAWFDLNILLKNPRDVFNAYFTCGSMNGVIYMLVNCLFYLGFTYLEYKQYTYLQSLFSTVRFMHNECISPTILNHKHSVYRTFTSPFCNWDCVQSSPSVPPPSRVPSTLVCVIKNSWKQQRWYSETKL